jgi:hypothetical protein
VFANNLQLGDTEVVEFTFTLPRGQELPQWLAAFKDGGKKDINPEVRVTTAALGASHDAVLHYVDSAELRVQVADRTQLAVFRPQGQVVVTWVVQVVKGNRSEPWRIFVQCHRFQDVPLRKPLSVGVGDEVSEKVRVALRQTGASFSAVETWLVDELTMPSAPSRVRRRMVYSGGSQAESAGKGFTIHGRRWLADVAVVDERLRVVLLTEAGNRQPPKWTMLSEVDIGFADHTSAGVADEDLRATLAGLASSGQSYIEMWNSYNEIERAAIIEDALRLGWGQYRDWQPQPDGLVRFYLHQTKRDAAFLRAAETYDGELELEAAAWLPKEIAGRSGDRITGVPGVVKNVSLANWTIDLRPSRENDTTDPAQYGWLFRSLSGDRIRLRRRDEARDRIWSGQAEMRGLALLFEGTPDLHAQQRVDKRYDHVLTDSVREAFGGNDPTPSQLEALQMALRTPDILLVQGPPGTGKTQFISALLRALDQLGDTSHTVNRTLLTSFEHEAVDNVASRARHHGLPPTRVDSRPGRGKQSVMDWRDDTVAAVNAYLDTHRPDVARRDEINQLRRLAESYSEVPVSDGDLLHILDEAKRLAGTDLPVEFRGRLERARATVRGRLATRAPMTAAQHALASATIRSIRTSETAFADDGPARADYALRVLTDLDLLDPTGRAVLELASTDQHAQRDQLLMELTQVRLDLLRRLHAGQLGTVRVTYDPDIEVLLHELAERVAEINAENADSADDVLLAYRADLEEDLALVEKTLQRYNAVLASTVQQAQSQQMNRVLDAPLPVFSTVIVDEAARANPLDLMIPLSCARERIIMVGDHKQLPHAIEMKIEQALMRDKTMSESSLSTSLFERWFTIFGEPEKKIRTIRLETQFRMHPVLGRFVSNVFYGGPDAIKPHESTHTLTHNLAPYQDKVAAWIDVPLSAGGDQKSGTSRVRQAEAKRLAGELRELARLDHSRKLTFGVITFYKEQRICIEKELIDADLGVVDEEGKFRPSADMALTDESKSRPRLRVGTVDAFQGMEFDVVLLSVTRSSPPPNGRGDTRDAVRRYGHLLRDSRMCVALSRQRRLLIAVGDAAMAERSSLPEQVDEQGRARSLAEGLVAFRELCEGEHGAGIRS